jgi:hypothetical protein
MRYLNTYIGACIVVDAALLIFSLVYFVFKTHQAYVLYVSDLLNEYPEYKIVMATLVYLQILVTWLYAVSRRHSHLIRFWFISFAVCAAVVGWSIVLFGGIPKRTDDESFSPLHFAGACTYLGGDVLYFALFMQDGWTRYAKTRTWLHLLLFIAMCAAFVGCAVFGILFIVFIRRNWVYQHMLFQCFLAGHLIFFINTLRWPSDSDDYAKEFNMFTDVQITKPKS